MSLSETSLPEIDIVLIHGTWARNAEWIQPDSPLRAALEEGVGEKAEVVSVPWSGRNREKDRQRAAEAVREIVEDSTADIKVLIGHSHGGNIGASALHRVEDEDGVGDHSKCALITLNTPFLIPTKRSTQIQIFHAILLSIGALLLAEYTVGSYFAGLPSIVLPVIVLVVLPVFLIVMAFLLSTLMTFVMVLKKIPIESVESYFSNLKRFLSEKNVIDDTTQVLCISTADDEALGWLQIIESLLNIPFLLLHRFALPIVLLGIGAAHYLMQWDFSRDAVWLAVAILQDGEQLTLWTAINPPHSFGGFSQNDITQVSQCIWGNVPDKSECDLLSYLLPGFLMQSVLSYFLTFWMMLAIFGLLGSYVLGAVFFGTGYGLRGILFAFARRFRVSPVPTQFQNVQLVTADPETSGWIRHSNLYADPNVLKIVANWISVFRLKQLKKEYQ